MPIKNQTVSLTIESVDGMMNGVAHADGQTVFIPGTLSGEKITAQFVKCAKNYAFARILSYEEKSPLRVLPPCPVYQQCGGCSALHLRYDATLEIKREAVAQILRRIGGVDIEVPPVIGMDEPFRYRNKTAMPVSGTAGAPVAGFYSSRSHRLVPVRECLISKPESNLIAAAVLEWMRAYQIAPYDEATGHGLIRHIVSRVSRAGESMAVVVASDPNVPHTAELCVLLKKRVPGLISVCLSVNSRGDNVILGSSYRVLDGAERLNDTLCGYHFSLSPLSFFQINPIQTEKLYQTALRFAELSGNETVVDLYCGAGTISLLLAKAARRVIGIEIVPEAIADAKENALANGVDHIAFHAGAAEELLPAFVADGLRPDVVVLDPPRKGAEKAVLDAIAKAAPTRVVYISCDPATQARDIKLLTASGYHLSRVQPVDMFCWTAHVENVALLEKDDICSACQSI